MTLRQHRVRLRYWQQRLNIREWKIDIQRMPKKDEAKFIGNVSWTPETLDATISLSKGAEEDTLLHEILHVAVYGSRPYDGYDFDREKAINRLVAALMATN